MTVAGPWNQEYVKEYFVSLEIPHSRLRQVRNGLSIDIVPGASPGQFSISSDTSVVKVFNK